jgi:hypothetical protein
LRTLPFTFKFFGVDYTTTYVSSNGYFTFGQGDATYTESLPAFTRYPRISAFFDDLIGASVYVNDQLPGRFIVTHDRVRHYSTGGSNTIQLQIYQDGRIVFAYDGVTAVATGSITGLTPGPNAPFQQIDYSVDRNATVPAGTSVYEYFTSASRFDLDRGFVIFTPQAGGGYNVRTVLPSAAPLSSFVSGAPAARNTTKKRVRRYANAEVLVTSSTDKSYIGMTNTDARGRFGINGVPAGGIHVEFRRKGRVVAQGYGVMSGDRLSEAQAIDIVVEPLKHRTKRRDR